MLGAVFVAAGADMAAGALMDFGPPVDATLLPVGLRPAVSLALQPTSNSAAKAQAELTRFQTIDLFSCDFLLIPCSGVMSRRSACLSLTSKRYAGALEALDRWPEHGKTLRFTRIKNLAVKC